jgi:hypothetical protein
LLGRGREKSAALKGELKANPPGERSVIKIDSSVIIIDVWQADLLKFKSPE